MAMVLSEQENEIKNEIKKKFDFFVRNSTEPASKVAYLAFSSSLVMFLA